MSKRWVAEVQETEAGEAFIEFTPEILKEAGWKEGDTISWSDNKDGSYTLNKIENEKTEWVLVETVSSFRHRYVVEVPAGKAEWALDTVTMEEAKEFSQCHIGENIVSYRSISLEDALHQCNIDNGNFEGWTNDKKIEVFFTKKEEYIK